MYVVVSECPTMASIMSDFWKGKKREMKGKMGAGPLNLLKVTLAVEQGACNNVGKCNNIDHPPFFLSVPVIRSRNQQSEHISWYLEGSFLSTLVQQAMCKLLQEHVHSWLSQVAGTVLRAKIKHNLLCMLFPGNHKPSAEFRIPR